MADQKLTAPLVQGGEDSMGLDPGCLPESCLQLTEDGSLKLSVSLEQLKEIGLVDNLNAYTVS